VSTVTRPPILGPNPTDREAWLWARQQQITSTDIAKIMRGEGWSVYHTKLGDIPEFAGNRATRRGNRFQRPTLEEYAEEAGAVVFDGLPLLIDPDCPALAATPDAVGFTPEDGVSPQVVSGIEVSLQGEGWGLQGSGWGVEAKTSLSVSVANTLAEGDETSDFVPEDWIWQTQCQMACAGWEWVDVAILLFGKLLRRRVTRNPTLIDACRATAVEYADRVIRRIEPPFDGSALANQNAVKQLYGPKPGVTIDLSEETAALWVKRAAAAAAESAAKKDKDGYDAAVRREFANAELGRLPNGDTLRLGIVNCAEQVQAAYSYSRFWYKKASAKA